MSDADNRTAGQRVAELRRKRAMSQRDLAAEMGRSESCVSQVERGIQPIERLSVLQALADALGVPVRELRPEAEIAPEPEPEQEPQSNDLDPLRVALTGHPTLGSLFGQITACPEPSLDDFHRHVDELWDLAHAASYAALSDRLSKVLPQLEAAVRHGPEAERAELHALLARTYQVAAASFVRQDEPDAAWVAADRALQAAERAGQPLEVVAGLFRLAHAFIRQQRPDQAEQAAMSAINVLTPRSQADASPPEERSLPGAMHLVMAVISAREGDRSATHAHIAEARRIAATNRSDRNDFDTEFGPTNVEIHAVSTAVDLGDAGMALDVAERVDPSGLSPERQARFLVDVARAHAQRRHVGEATAALLEAEALAPQQVHSHHLAREAVRDLIQFSGHRIPEPLAGLADRMAIA
ncbi:helix-turn-helix domain-containing protein [Streptomyces sp. NPDC088354]|uniref:helix-turn-helix domain-containing protein n=1 Tax=Streptomyces sp. NPDC088354 TaxID=3365856 RepID=UPI003823AA5A